MELRSAPPKSRFRGKRNNERKLPTEQSERQKRASDIKEQRMVTALHIQGHIKGSAVYIQRHIQGSALYIHRNIQVYYIAQEKYQALLKIYLYFQYKFFSI